MQSQICVVYELNRLVIMVLVVLQGRVHREPMGLVGSDEGAVAVGGVRGSRLRSGSGV